MIWLHIQAPFAAFRPFSAGSFRPTAGFLTHSAAYGLVLNLAGIESRLWEHDSDHDGAAPASLLRPGLPTIRLALGIPSDASPPVSQTIYQQLHNYPLMAGQGLPPQLAKGRKNSIQPIRREFLSDVRVVAAVDAQPEIEDALRRGLCGQGAVRRYGLPFLGDNSFLLDSLEEVQPRPARWYVSVATRTGRPSPGTTRLTAWIDRTGMAETRSGLFAPEPEIRDHPPASAWIRVGPAERQSQA
jgi:CRISPR-associated protein Cas5t